MGKAQSAKKRNQRREKKRGHKAAAVGASPVAGFRCPSWQDECPPNKRVAYEARLNVLYASVLNLPAGYSFPANELLRQWHQEMFEDIVPVKYYAGNFRCCDPSMPCLKEEVEIGGVLGLPSRDVPSAMQRLCSDVNKGIDDIMAISGTLSPAMYFKSVAAVIATAIGDMIRIHPFRNGNGRVSRLWWTEMLVRFRLPPQVRLSPRPGPPYSTLMASAMRGDDNPLIRHVFLQLVSP